VGFDGSHAAGHWFHVLCDPASQTNTARLAMMAIRSVTLLA
jgi:hypothetical protein